jgi:hypothetical protein
VYIVFDICGKLMAQGFQHQSHSKQAELKIMKKINEAFIDKHAARISRKSPISWKDWDSLRLSKSSC